MTGSIYNWISFKDSNNVMSVSEYLQRYGYSKYSVLYQAQARRIRGAYQVNDDWYIPEDTLIEYIARFKHMLQLDKLVSEIL